MVKKIKGAPKVTVAQLDAKKCKVDRPEGPFGYLLWSGSKVRENPTRAPFHDGAWDKMAAQYERVRVMFSWAAPSLWKYNPEDKQLTCEQDKAFGATYACYEKGNEVVGQRKAVEAVAQQKSSVLRMMQAWLSMSSTDPLKQFKAMENVVANNDNSLLDILKDMGNSSDADGVEARAYDLFKTVSATAAAQLAAAARIKAAQLIKARGCDDPTAKTLQEKGNLWERIARRLVFGQDALRFQSREIEDPLWVQGNSSSMSCSIDPKKATKDELYMLSAIRFFNKKSKYGEINGPTLALLASAKTMLAGALAEKGCGKKKITITTDPDPKPVEKCPKPNMIRVGKKCVCKDGYKYFKRLKRCEIKKTCRPPLLYNRLTNRCYKKPPPKRCTGGKIRVSGRCKCPTGLKWIKGKCRKKSSGDGLGDSNVYK